MILPFLVDFSLFPEFSSLTKKILEKKLYRKFKKALIEMSTSIKKYYYFAHIL